MSSKKFMRKKIYFGLAAIAIIAIAVSASLTVNYFTMAWTEPTEDPPGGVIPTVLSDCSDCDGNFVNVGGDTMTGQLDVNGDIITGGKLTTTGSGLDAQECGWYGA